MELINFENFNNICRTCLSAESLVPLLKCFLSSGVLLTDILADFIQDIENIQLPQKICSVCLDKLDSYYKFKQACIENETVLKDSLENYVKEKCKIEITETVLVDNCDQSCNVNNSSDDDLPLVTRVKHKKYNKRGEYVCKICKKSFVYKSRLKMHIRVHTQERSFKCDQCSLSFTFNGNLKRHKLVHSGNRPQPYFPCTICGRTFIRAKPYNLHMKKHRSTEYIEEKPSEEQVIKDVPIEGEKSFGYKCQVCDKKYLKLIHLKRHEDRHGEKKFLCTNCGKGFVRQADLQSHFRVHTGEKPHKCTQCDKSYSHRGSLVSHTLVHSGYKPYSCYICSKQFSQLSHLKAHQRTHSGERPHSCSFCGKSFVLKSNLTVHIRTHTGETPHICSVCGRGFYDSSSLKKHEQNHLNSSSDNAQHESVNCQVGI